MTDAFGYLVKTGLEGAWAESRGAVRMLPNGGEGHNRGAHIRMTAAEMKTSGSI